MILLVGLPRVLVPSFHLLLHKTLGIFNASSLPLLPSTNRFANNMLNGCRTSPSSKPNSTKWILPRSGHLHVVPISSPETLTMVAQMGKLAQRFNLSQAKRKHDEQASAPGRTGKASSLTSQPHPVQLPGSQVLRRVDASDVPTNPLPMVAGAPDGPRSRPAPPFNVSSKVTSRNSSASMVSNAFSHCCNENNCLFTNRSTIIHSSCLWKSTPPRLPIRNSERSWNSSSA